MEPIPIKIKLQLRGKEFWWQSGFAELCNKDARDIRQLLAESKVVSSSIEWEISAGEKEKQFLSECCELLLQGAQNIEQKAADFAIQHGSEKERFFVSIFHDLNDHEPDLNTKRTCLAHVFLVVHVISKKKFRRLGPKGASKLFQWIFSNKDQLECSAVADQVNQIMKAATTSCQTSNTSDVQRRSTKSPANSSVVHITPHYGAHNNEDPREEESVDDYVASELIETLVDELVDEHGDVQTDINLPCKRNSAKVVHPFRSDRVSEDLQPPTVSPLSEYGRIDVATVQSPFCTAQSPSPVDDSIISAAPFVRRSTTEVSDVRVAKNKRRRRDSTVSQSSGFKTTESFQNTCLSPFSVPHCTPLQFNMQRLSPASLQLLCIFDALGGNRIPKLLFEAYLSPQSRWNEEGHIVRVEFVYDDCGLSHSELLNSESLTVCLEELLLGSWISQNDHENLPSTTFSLTNETNNYMQLLGNKDPRPWFILGLQLSCHAFPRDPVLDENFNKNALQLAHIIDHLYLQTGSYIPPDSLKLELAESFVAKARLARLRCTEESLERADALFRGVAPDYIEASIALRRSISLRLEGSYEKSEKVIVDYQEKARRQEMVNARLRALNRLITISHVENLIQLEDYETGRKEIHNLNDSEPNSNKTWSLMDLSVNFKKWSTVSKIYQSQGYLDESRDYLSNCYPYLRTEEFRADPNRFQIICRLSDLLCADGCLDDARSKIEHELYLMGVHGKLLKASRRLEVSMLDVNIAEGRLKEASTLALSLKGQFSRILSPDISDQWLHVRSVVASARLLYCQGNYPEAVSEWRNLLLLTTKYPLSFEPEGFYFGLGHMSMSVALLQVDQSSSKSDDQVALELREKDAKKAFDIGCDVLARENLNFWIPLLSKRYIPDLLDEIKYLRPAWADTLDFHSLQKKYTNFLDFAKRKSGFSSRI